MRSVRKTICTIILFTLMAGCSQTDNDYSVFANHENNSDELRKSLLECLNSEKIDYKVDNNKNVLIREKDMKQAVASCS
ncbi:MULTISPECIES: hypothetical protein [Bacillaceae]|uniref:Lipoprotein n=1 Tax=Metabacillus sediminis TaxID=3117746 RepID=A0ABZ2NIA2_9BACI|nr:hypothetical protein [Bacillus sp. SJS]